MVENSCLPLPFHISEIFYSLQGEGVFTGVPSVFIRLAGCHLRCRWCDTAYAWQQESGQIMSLENIVEQVGRYDCAHAVVTGGEPLLEPHLPELMNALVQRHKTLTLETAAPRFVELPCHLLSISPKLTNSTPVSSSFAAVHEQQRLNLEAIRQYIDRFEYQLKFVVDCEADLQEVAAILEKLGNVVRDRVFLMPQASTRAQYRQKISLVGRLCRKYGYRFSPRLQVELWDNARKH